MADEKHHQHSGEEVAAEVKDRGVFDFLGKKKEHEGEDKCQEEVLVTEFEKVQVTEEVEVKEEKKEGLLEKLHRSHSSSSSSSSDEEEAAEGEEKKKKKKGLKEKIKEKISGEKKEEAKEEYVETKVEAEAAAVVVEDNTIPVEKIEELAQPESEAQEKKSLLEKIKEKLPGGKKPAEEAPAATEQCAEQGKEHHEGDSPKEKKGFLGKIMDKIPGYHKGNGAEETGTASN